MLCSLAFVLLAHPQPVAPLKMIFFGNSFTYMNNVPELVKNLFESDGSGRRVIVKMYAGANLIDHINEPARVNDLRNGGYDVAVLQGQPISLSHRKIYDNEGAAELARIAAKAKSRVILWADWPRQGWDESEYIMDIIRLIKKKAGLGEIASIGYAWDLALKWKPDLPLWVSDGNHATTAGSYLAACDVYYRLTRGEKTNPTWRPDSLSEPIAALCRKAAAQIERNPKRTE